MQKKNSLTLKWGIAAASALALTFGGVAPAMAANVNIGESDVQSHENGNEESSTYNYDQWHVGSTENPDAKTSDSLDFTGCAVTFLEAPSDEAEWVQILKGFPIADRPSTVLDAADDAATGAQLRGLLDSISITVVTGQVTVQIPIFQRWLEHSEAPGEVDFTTLRTELLGPGTYRLADLAAADSNNWEFGSTIGEFFDGMIDDAFEFQDVIYEILGVGANGNAGASVATLSFGGNTYYFGEGTCAPASVDPPTHVSTAAA